MVTVYIVFTDAQHSKDVYIPNQNATLNYSRLCLTVQIFPFLFLSVYVICVAHAAASFQKSEKDWISFGHFHILTLVASGVGIIMTSTYQLLDFFFLLDVILSGCKSKQA